MTTSDIFILLAAVFAITGIYLFRKKTPAKAKDKVQRFPIKYRPAAVLSFVLAAISGTLAYINNSTNDTLPETETTTVIAEGGRFPLPPPIEASAKPGEALPDPVEQLRHERQLEADFSRVNAALKKNPNDVISLGDRGAIYAERKSFDLAEKDFQAALNINPKLAKATFDLAEMEFQQKRYDSARTGFASLTNDPNLGELSTYKVFLCDLYGGHAEQAQKDLDAINHGGSDATYYYANIASLLYQHRPKEARDWLKSATYIFAEPKAALYTSSLNDLGYLPIPDIN